MATSLDLAAMRIAPSSGMRRMLALCQAALAAAEPVLLVGDTGVGKTSACQVLAQAAGRRLHIVNVHEHTDTSDLIGGLRPVRGREQLLDRARDALRRVGIDDVVVDERVLDSIVGDGPEQFAARAAVRQLSSLFEWADGPLVTAMRSGDWILIDEISLADDVTMIVVHRRRRSD
jgi:midasin